MSPADVKVTQAHVERADALLAMRAWTADDLRLMLAAEFAAVEQAAFEAGAKAQREADAMRLSGWTDVSPNTLRWADRIRAEPRVTLADVLPKP